MADRQGHYADTIQDLSNRCTKAALKELSTEEVHQRMQVLDTFYEKFQEEHERDMKGSSPRANQASMHVDVELAYRGVRQRLSERLEISTPDAQPRAAPVSQVKERVPLDPALIGRFSGDLRDWMRFREVFARYVHSNRDLEPFTKYKYLLNALTDRAALLTRNWDKSEHGYEAAWANLREYYDEPLHQIQVYMDELMQISQEKGRSENCFRWMRRQLQFICTQLSATKQHTLEHWSPVMIWTARTILGAELTADLLRKYQTLTVPHIIRFVYDLEHEQQQLSGNMAKPLTSRQDASPPGGSVKNPKKPQAYMKSSQPQATGGQSKIEQRMVPPLGASSGDGKQSLLFDSAITSPSFIRNHPTSQPTRMENPNPFSKATGQAERMTRETNLFGPASGAAQVQSVAPNSIIIKKAPLPTSQEKRDTPCAYCHKDHAMHRCRHFIALTLTQRQEVVQERKVCPNCFRLGHPLVACPLGECHTCRNNIKHNSLICDGPPERNVAEKRQISFGQKTQWPQQEEGVKSPASQKPPPIVQKISSDRGGQTDQWRLYAPTPEIRLDRDNIPGQDPFGYGRAVDSQWSGPRAGGYHPPERAENSPRESLQQRTDQQRLGTYFSRTESRSPLDRRDRVGEDEWSEHRSQSSAESEARQKRKRGKHRKGRHSRKARRRERKADARRSEPIEDWNDDVAPPQASTQPKKVNQSKPSTEQKDSDAKLQSQRASDGNQMKHPNAVVIPEPAGEKMDTNESIRPSGKSDREEVGGQTPQPIASPMRHQWPTECAQERKGGSPTAMEMGGDAEEISAEKEASLLNSDAEDSIALTDNVIAIVDRMQRSRSANDVRSVCPTAWNNPRNVEALPPALLLAADQTSAPETGQPIKTGDGLAGKD